MKKAKNLWSQKKPNSAKKIAVLMLRVFLYNVGLGCGWHLFTGDRLRFDPDHWPIARRHFVLLERFGFAVSSLDFTKWRMASTNCITLDSILFGGRGVGRGGRRRNSMSADICTPFITSGPRLVRRRSQVFLQNKWRCLGGGVYLLKANLRINQICLQKLKKIFY
jgi:hypothetical protein